MRATTLRSTWVFPVVGLVLAVLGAVLTNLTVESDWSSTLESYVSNSYTFLSVLFITIPFAQAFGHEYRDGTMRLTLSLFPNRRNVFAAKLLVPAVIAVIAATLSGLAVAAVGWSSGHVTGSDQLVPVLLRIVGFTLMWGLLVAAFTVITRNLAAGITGVLIWSLLVEQLLGLLHTVVERIDEYLPLQNGTVWMSNGNVRSGVVMLIPTLAITAVAYVRFLRSDA
ncbi:MAG: ABC transporter permease subunit [Actinomycetes bacterium]